MPIPQPLWCHDCRRWTHPKGRSPHLSTIGKGEDTTSYTQRTHGNYQVPVPCKTMCILAWNQWRHQENGCPICQRHHPQEPRQPLQPTPAPEHPWQHLGADYFTFDGFEYLIIIDYYTKMPFIRKIPPSQCNAAKTISVLKELFSEHGIPETIDRYRVPEYSLIQC